MSGDAYDAVTEYPESTMIVLPTIGKFIVRIKRKMHPRSGNLHYYLVLVGTDPRNACVNIAAPYNSEDPLKLAYVTSEVGCTLDNITPMKGLATIQMIQLGITIARKLSPKSTTLVLEDCSHFTCSSPDGTKKMALPSFYIAFHGKTWYEDKFGAVLRDPEMRINYEKGISNMKNPDKKPDTFDFLNDDLTKALLPLYDACKTWDEFFQRIERKYKAKKCMVVQPWIDDAMRHIFEKFVYEMKEWVVDLKHVPELSYYVVREPVPTLGGGWNYPMTERVMQRSSFYQKFRCMNYKRALANTRTNKRRTARHTRRAVVL